MNAADLKVKEYLRSLDLKQIEFPEYARLLKFAFDEGRLPAILKHAGLTHKVLIIVPLKIRRQMSPRPANQLKASQL
jgi:hypothetical protein